MITSLGTINSVPEAPGANANGIYVLDAGFGGFSMPFGEVPPVVGVVPKLIPLTGSGQSVLPALTGSGQSVLVALTGSGTSILPTLKGDRSVVDKNQDFEIVRGTDVQQPFTVTLDQGRTLDDTETWHWQCKEKKTDAAALITKTNGAGAITTDANGQPTLVLAPADTPLVKFPSTEEPKPYWHGLEMVKDSLREAVAEGKMIVNTDVEQ